MNAVTWTIIEFLANCLDLIFILLIPTFQIGRLRNNIKKGHIASYILICSALLFVYNYFTNNSITSLITFLAVALFYIAYFTIGKWYIKGFWLIFPFSSVFFIDRLVIDFIIDIYNLESTGIHDQNKYRLMAMIIAKSVELIILALCYRYRLKVDKEAKVLIIPIVISIIVPFILILTGRHIWHFTSALLLINCYYLIHIFNQAEKSKREERVLHLKEQAAFESDYLHQLLARYPEELSEKIKHIWEQMKTNETTEKGKIFDELNNINLRMRKSFNTGNHELDLVLSIKENQAKQKGIKLNVYIDTPLAYRINYVDVCLILVEQIDNAMASAEKAHLEHGADKVITLAMKKTKHHCIIQIENPMTKILTPSLSYILSDESKGQGFKFIKNKVDENDGTMEIRQEDGRFTCIIELPIAQ